MIQRCDGKSLALCDFKLRFVSPKPLLAAGFLAIFGSVSAEIASDLRLDDLCALSIAIVGGRASEIYQKKQALFAPVQTSFAPVQETFLHFRTRAPNHLSNSPLTTLGQFGRFDSSPCPLRSQRKRAVSVDFRKHPAQRVATRSRAVSTQGSRKVCLSQCPNPGT